MIKIVEGKTISLPNFEEHIKSIEEIEIELTEHVIWIVRYV